MKWFSAVLFVSLLATPSLAAAPKGPEVDLIDNRLSINAEAISLGRLLGLLDVATGMKSKVPPELANRNISVKFSGLTLTDGVRKIFQGQPIDYVVIPGQGVIVTAASQLAAGAEPVPVYNPQPQPIEQPFIQDFPPGFPQQQPPTVQTPFGPIPNPRAGQPIPQMPPSIPGQQNSLFPQPVQQPVPPNNQQGMPFYGIVPGTPPPFGTPSPFGTPTPSPNNINPNGLFAPPPVFNSPGTQPRTP